MNIPTHHAQNTLRKPTSSNMAAMRNITYSTNLT